MLTSLSLGSWNAGSNRQTTCFSVRVDGAPKVLLEIVAFPGGLGHDPQYNQSLAWSGDVRVVQYQPSDCLVLGLTADAFSQHLSASGFMSKKRYVGMCVCECVHLSVCMSVCPRAFSEMRTVPLTAVS